MSVFVRMVHKLHNGQKFETWVYNTPYCATAMVPEIPLMHSEIALLHF